MRVTSEVKISGVPIDLTMLEAGCDARGWMDVRQRCSNFGRGEQPENERLNALLENCVSMDTMVASEGAHT